MEKFRSDPEDTRSGKSERDLRLAHSAGSDPRSQSRSALQGVREAKASRLPERYFIKELEKGRVLACMEAPTLSVRVERDLSINAASARKYAPGSIFLDGAAQGEPFIDSEKQLFNLDHHEGCIRAFTLATCEQAMVLVRMGLDLRKRDWVIYANEPDLDTVLAIWILLNHIRLNDDNSVIRRTIMPLVRLQGTIDAHGLELQELAGFPPKLYLDTFAQLEQLRARELELKREGRWQETDYLGYTLEVLRVIDSLVYSSLDFEKTLEVEELAHATISDHWLIIACKSEAGIYEVEQHLRRLHGERLGIIVLQKNDTAYTLRRVNHFLPVSLESIYARLNTMDPAAGGARSGNRWGGSEEIGGSPRSTGTSLSVEQIVEICSTAYRKPGRQFTLSKLLLAVAASLTVPLAAVSVIALHGFLRRPFPALTDVFQQRTEIFAAVLGGISLLAWLIPWRRWQDYGLRLPVGFDWLLALPAAALPSLAGGAWFPSAFRPGPALWSNGNLGAIAVILSFAVSAELIFRGLALGVLGRAYSTQKPGGNWFLSWPVIFSSLLYAFWALFPFRGITPPGALEAGLSALGVGIFCGMARERSGSLAAPILIHCLCMFVPVLG